MAPGDEETRRERGPDDIANPFIAFRRFADEQMSNLVKGIFGLSTPSDSSNSSPSSSDRAFQDYQAWLRDTRALQANLHREEEEAGQIMNVLARAHHDSAQEDILTPAQDTDGSLRCPYRPDAQGSTKSQNPDPDHSFASFGIHLPHPMFAAPMEYNGLPPKGIAYLLYSPYSPVHLEQHPGLRNRGIQWREAFEDLVAVRSGEEMSSKSKSDQRLSGVDWGEQMSDRKMGNKKPVECCDLFMELEMNRVRDLFPAHGENTTEEPDDKDEPVTELDLYENFLGRQDSSSNNESSSQPNSESQSRSYAHLQHDSAPTNRVGSKPSILSTLTTTERTSLQDGTIHTKVVLKKRFSDGREESTETMHTQNPTPKIGYQPPAKMSKQLESSQEPSRAEKGAKKSNGWFWS